MANLHSKISLLLLFSIFFVIINCESEKRPEDKLNVPQENKDFNSFAGKPYSYMEPNFFEKIGLHLAKGWHGFRGLFGRRSNRRNENNYKNGAYEGKEEFQQPFEKESTTNKEYPEFGNNNFGNNNGNGYSGETQGQEQGQEQGQLFQGNQKGNQEEIGFVDQRNKENSEKGPKDDKKFGYEDLPGNSGKTGIKNGENKKLEERKPSKPENDNYEAVFGKQNVPNGKQRKIRAAFLGNRLPIRGPFRQPFRPPFRLPFRRPGLFNRFQG